MHGGNTGVSSREECIDSVFSFIKSQEPDIICLQEFSLRNGQKAKDYLQKRFKGYNAEYYLFPEEAGSFGNVTLSRLPVNGKGKIKFEESANLAIYTDHKVEDRRFRVYNCHFESYNISFTGLIRGLAQRDSTVMAETSSKMKRSITRRPKQVDKVFEDIENCPVYEVFSLSYPIFYFPHNLFPLVAIANYLLFFGKDIVNVFPISWRLNTRRLFRKKPKQPKVVPFPNAGSYQATTAKPKDLYTHRCSICGRTDVTNPELEFRYCSKCNGYHCYCEDHISNHTHIE